MLRETGGGGTGGGGDSITVLRETGGGGDGRGGIVSQCSGRALWEMSEILQQPMAQDKGPCSGWGPKLRPSHPIAKMFCHHLGIWGLWGKRKGFGGCWGGLERPGIAEGVCWEAFEGTYPLRLGQLD